MTIRVFNPEHDLALASNLERFTSPHAGRQLRNDLSFLPGLWSESGDVVVVDDVDFAEASWRSLRKVRKEEVEFCTLSQLSHVIRQEDVTSLSVDVWGWDAAIRFQLADAGVPETLLPAKEMLSEIRRLSSRQTTVSLLSSLRDGLKVNTCGRSMYVTDKEMFKEILLKERNIVVKAPWSSSGRGIRYVMDGDVSVNTDNWIANTIRSQGGVMVEPLYNKVKDFAMEFVRDAAGDVRYVGLSLFETRNTSYTGNLLASEEEKRDILSCYLDLALVDEISARLQRLLSLLLSPLSNLPLCLGVDMMVVADENAGGFLLHPCVELNLRRTMGHVALNLYTALLSPMSSMSAVFENKRYRILVDN